MASLIPSQASKAAKTAPRNANERRILAARAGHAALNAAFAAKPTQKATQPTASAASSFVSGFGGSSNMAEPVRSKTSKADPLAGLPERARRAADRLSDGQKQFLSLVYQRAATTKEHVSFSKAEVGVVMGVDADTAGRAVDALATAGLLKPSLNSLGGVAGYRPGMTD